MTRTHYSPTATEKVVARAMDKKRVKSGFSAAEISQEMGMSRGQLNNMLTGTQGWTIQRVYDFESAIKRLKAKSQGH